MLGGIGFGSVAEETELHEKAHASVWFEKTKPCFEEKIKAKYGNTGNRLLKKQEEKDISKMYWDCWYQSQEESAKRANEATVNYYDSRPNLYKRTFPVKNSNIKYEYYADPQNKQFSINATDVWKVLKK